MSTLRRRGGFTLAELLVGLAVTSIVMTAVVAIFIGVQRAYQGETEVKIITENGRGALLFLERVVPLAGYGLDPRLAFDVTRTAAQDNEDVGTITFSPAQPAMVGPTGTIVTDDLALRYRDPAFLRGGRLSAGNTTLDLDTPVGVGLPIGKLLMVGCRGGIDYAMVRITTTAVVATDQTGITVSNAGAPFTTNSANCLSATGAASPWVFLVQEHRLRIVNLAGRPWLVSFRDLSSSVTTLSGNNFDPVAADVESFQVAFGINMARPALTCCTGVPDTGGNTNYIVGDAAGETFFGQPTGLLGTAPDYKSGYDDPSRFTRHPANIRSVYVMLGLRSSRALPDGRRVAQPGNLFNYAYTPATDGFRRSLFHTSVNTPNLVGRNGFMPALRSSADTRDLNSWGG